MVTIHEFTKTNYDFTHLCMPLEYPEGMSEIRQVYRDMKPFYSGEDVKGDEAYLRNYLGYAFGLSMEIVDKYLLDIECFDDEDKGE